MESNNYSNLIGSKRFKLATNTDTNIQIQLEEKTKPLNEYGVIKIVDLEDVFTEERDSCKKYRINGKLNIYTGNKLSPTATNKYWDPLFYGNPPSPPNWVMQVLYPTSNDYNMIVGDNEAYRGLDFKRLSTTIINGKNKLTIIGRQKHNLFVGDFVYLYSKNTSLQLQGFYQVLELGVDGVNSDTDVTLDFDVDTTPNVAGSFFRVVNVSYDDVNTQKNYKLLNQIVATDISGSTIGSYILNEVRYTTITTNLPHNLLKNNFVEIIGGGTTVLNGLWRVYNVISPTKFVIKLFSSNIKGTITPINATNQPKYKVLNATPSEYYVRRFEVLTTNDYETYPCAFSSTIYSEGVSNTTWMFQFNQDINVKNLKDNRGGEISQLYFSIIKRAGSKPYPWSTVTSHWDFNFSAATGTNSIQNISLSTNNVGTIENLSARTETISNGEIQTIEGSKYIGDFVEFNSFEIKEVTCAEIINRFTTLDTTEGYYYKPFKKLEIRKYSAIIEYAEISDNFINVPDNYVTYPDGSIGWRDLLPVGFYQDGNNGVEYPFVNNSHYFYFNHNLFVRRQNPQNIIEDPTDLSIDPNNLNVKC